MTSDIQIEDYDDATMRLTLTDDNGAVDVLDIKKENVSTSVSGDYVNVFWHKYGIERGAQFRSLDFNLVSNMIVTSADDLAARITEIKSRTRSESTEHYRHFLYAAI